MSDVPRVGQRAETRTMIYGSCVSRDTFEYLPDGYRLLTYVARQSAISAAAPAAGVRQRLRELPSAFQNRMVAGDVRGDLHDVLDRQAPDIDLLLIDLIDERGGVIPVGGGFVTKLSEFWSAGGREATAGLPVIQLGSEDHFQRWAAAFDLLVDHLDGLGLKRRTVVLRTPWARLAPDGTPIPVPSWMTPPEVANDQYERYFAHVEALGLAVLELPEALARSPLDHRWGPSPFHYTEEAYRHLADGITDFAEGTQAAAEEPVGGVAVSDSGEGQPSTATLDVPRRDPSAWGDAQVYLSAAELATAPLRDGLVTITTPAAPVDLLVENNGAATTIVSLHAAMGQKPMDLPIFTGRSVTEGLPVNRVFLSDATLCLDPDLKLGWYLGGADLDLTSVLRDALVALQQRFGARHLVLFGMSGGGFATLNLSHLIPGSLAVPVNPQTRIADYHPPAWQAFAKAGFDADGEEAALAVLDAHPRTDLRTVYAAGFDNTVIYLQNAGDGHVRTQLQPWLASLPTRQGVHVLLRDWGRGHVPPTARELRELMQHVAAVDGDWSALARRWSAVPASDVDL